MYMKYRLTCPGIVIIDDPEPLFVQTPLARQAGGNLHYMTDKGVVCGIKVQGIDEVLAGDDENMHRRDRRNIFDGYDTLILINQLCRNLTLNYLAKNAIVHYFLH